MEIFLIFIIGLCIGSFVNVVIDRIPNNESIIYGRSYCDNCKKKLGWQELIPIISFFILKRKCKNCKAKISWQYPIVELVTGMMFIGTYLFLMVNVSLQLIYYLAVISSLIAIFVTDLRYGIIPDKILAFMFIIILPYLFIFNKDFFLSSLISAIGAFAFFLLLF